MPDCGDGILTGNEPCDPGIAVEKNACSSDLPLESGLRVHGQPGQRVPHDEVRRRQEGRRRGLRRRQHGAVRRLLRDLRARAGVPIGRHGRRLHAASAATASCCPAKTCDDGNNLSGDGCSATCTVRIRVHVHAAAARRQHPGAGRLPRLQLPHAQSDFEPGGDGPDDDHTRTSSTRCWTHDGQARPIEHGLRRSSPARRRSRSGTRTSRASTRPTRGR